jgi:hypothetical protein
MADVAPTVSVSDGLWSHSGAVVISLVVLAHVAVLVWFFTRLSAQSPKKTSEFKRFAQKHD